MYISKYNKLKDDAAIEEDVIFRTTANIFHDQGSIKGCLEV